MTRSMEVLIMGNKNWQGYDDEDRKQADMEKGDHVPPRKRSRRDNGFYGHMKVQNLMKGGRKCRGI